MADSEMRPAVVDEAPAAHAGRRRRAYNLPAIYGRKYYLQIAGFIALVLVVKFAFTSGQSSQNSLNLWMLYSVAALGFYLVFGIAGRFAFSQTFMMALGAYISAWIATTHGTAVAVLGALALSTMVAFVLALLLIRANEFYFGIATLAIAGIGTIIFQTWTDFAGPSGQRFGIAPLQIGDWVVDTEAEAFWIFLAVLVVALVIVSFVERSPLRRDAIASRDMPMVARTLGIPVAWTQIVMFVAGSVFASVAGALYAHWLGVVSPTTFGLDLSIGIFLMAILGGLGSMWGVVIGAAFYVFIPQQLQALSEYQNIIYGGLLVVIIIVLPDGIIGIFARLRALRRGATNVPSGPGGDRGVLGWVTEVVNRARGR